MSRGWSVESSLLDAFAGGSSAAAHKAGTQRLAFAERLMGRGSPLDAVAVPVAPAEPPRVASQP